MKKLITQSKNRLVEKGRMIGVGLLSLALLMSSAIQPATAALNNSSKLTIAKADIVVKGKVTAQTTSAALAGVSVKIKGATAGVMTDASGNYTITAPDNGILTFDYIGYASQDVPVGSRATINVALVSSTEALEEVVVIGYGSVKKKDLTGAVSSVSAERLMDKPAFNVGQALQGKISGVQVIQNGGGVPGGNPVIRIRGSNSINTSNDPLFVVDGIVGVTNALTTLNPEDISSVEVLKDASATAIYGAQGANGVLLITTKRGISGKTSINYSGYATRGTLNRDTYVMNSEQMMYIYEQSMANADKFATGTTPFNRAKDFRGNAGLYTGLTYSEMPWIFKKVDAGSYSVPLIGKDGNSYAPIYDTDWQDLIYNPSLSNNHKVDVRGGSEDVKYSMSVGYSNEDGLMLKSYAKRYTARFTGDIKLAKWLSLNSSLSYLRNKTTGDGGITRDAAEVWAIVPIRYPDDPALGTYAKRWGTNADFNVGEQWYNIMFKRASIETLNYRNQTTGSLDLKGKITKDLGFSTQFSADLNQTKGNTFNGILYNTSNNANMNTNHSIKWQANAFFNYDKTLGSHNINAVAGTEVSENTSESLSASNTTFFSDWYSYHNLGAGTATRPGVGSGDSRSSLNSYFARANYNFKSKYLLTATARMDGSSKFGKTYQYGFFPSAGLAWNIAQEDFMKNIAVISNLKLRASIGKTGNQDIGGGGIYQTVGSTNVYINGATSAGIIPGGQSNPDLHWESTDQWDAGLEIGLWKGRLSFETDYYHKRTKDMLLSVGLPSSTTSGSVTMNYGASENKGWEFTLNTINVSSQAVNWNTAITVAMNTNKLVLLGPGEFQKLNSTGAGAPTNIYRIGFPIGSFYGLNRLGTWGTEEVSEAARYGLRPGDLKFADVNNDGKIVVDSPDGDIMGRAWPKAVIGFNNNVSWKDFDLGIDISIVRGVNKSFIHESAEDRQLVSGGLNSTLVAWRPDNQDSQVAQVRPGNGGAYYQSYADTHMIYDASFIRGSSLSLGYNFPKSMTSKMGVSRLNLYFAATNFFLLTRAAGFEAEGSSSGYSDNVPGSDKYAYPTPANYTLGLKLGF